MKNMEIKTNFVFPSYIQPFKFNKDGPIRIMSTCWHPVRTELRLVAVVPEYMLVDKEPLPL